MTTLALPGVYERVRGTTEVIIWFKCPIPCFETGHD
jgi:hypothetical protein